MRAVGGIQVVAGVHTPKWIKHNICVSMDMDKHNGDGGLFMSHEQQQRRGNSPRRVGNAKNNLTAIDIERKVHAMQVVRCVLLEL